MLLYQGKSPYSLFRKKKLLETLQRKQPSIKDIHANYLYFVETESLLKQEKEMLIKIVDSSCQPYQHNDLLSAVFVTPRFGTISPWSSKATDILQVCGLSKVKRIERGIVYKIDNVSDLDSILPLLHDRMTESCNVDEKILVHLFDHKEACANETIPLAKKGKEELVVANKKLGLALSEKEIDYLYQHYKERGRDPSIAELMMFAQINSEHCRHKIFNAEWTIDEEKKPKSLFNMIRNTYHKTSEGVISAYKDNGAIIKGADTEHFFADPHNHQYGYEKEPMHIVIKVETHNHPTAIAPFEGAATGSGGEIRDEGATGIGAKPKAGLAGFSVSNLHIPNLTQPWEKELGYPYHVASSLNIMLQGPIGAASFNNEFGRPNICGYFRTFEFNENNHENTINVRGYHKPIMIAGGLGQIRSLAVKKETIQVGAKLIVLGGPAMLIGLGGGAASSIYSGGSHEELDFASVQRSNPEMQRRCQEVINMCWSLGKKNPIISLHDVGAGGLSNALSELVHDSDKGALFNLRSIHSADSSLSAMEIWCNEAQERYVLAVKNEDVPLFEKIVNRERCPFAVVGEANDSHIIEVKDSKFDESPVNISLEVLFGEVSKVEKKIKTAKEKAHQKLEINLPLDQLIQRVLQLPTVADKSFLITIGDRSVTGLVARDQMIGPWQVPVSDVGVTASGYKDYTGEAMAMGERTPLALLDARASARIAVGEAITNIVAADVNKISDIKLSANWMAAVNYENEEQKLYEAVHEVGMELCPALEICIPVGKDSLSMQMKWKEEEKNYNVASPLSLIISAFAPVQDIRRTLTPELNKDMPTELLLIDLGKGKNRLGASSLAQVLMQLGDIPPNLDNPEILIQFFNAMKELRQKKILLAYHDRSDGGLLATISEMVFASHVGVTLDLDVLGTDYIASLFNEELGAVVQCTSENKNAVLDVLKKFGLESCSHVIGHLNEDDQLNIRFQEKIIFSDSRVNLHRLWSATSYHLKSLRDNPLCAEEEYNLLLDASNPGLHASLNFTVSDAPAITTTKPSVAILREQGVNGHMEMAAAFERAGFLTVDVHMTDIINGDVDLKRFQGLVACGGFSYGDVLGAGRGWANSILFNEGVRDQFVNFFNLPSVFVLGVCNGCQMLSNLKEIIPGAEDWPRFIKNTSDQFEARLSLVKVRKSPSILFNGMEESIIPIVVSHGEGRVDFEKNEQLNRVLENNLVSLQYVDNYEKVTTQYPSNPNGSEEGITALTNADGRFTIMMPHAERVFRNVQFSWRPKNWQAENSPWFQIFTNARNWLK